MDFDHANGIGDRAGVNPGTVSNAVMPEQVFQTAPQVPISSSAGDIVLVPSDEKASRKGLKITLTITISVILLIIAGFAIYYLIFNPAEVFKEKVSTYSRRYEKITSIYPAIVDAEDRDVNWAKIADDYAINETKYKAITELGREITAMNPTILDNALVSEAKMVIAKTSQISAEIVDNLSFLSSLYDGYMAYYLPYLENENYFDSIPVLESTIVSPKGESVDIFNEALRHFANFMELYSSNVKTLKSKENECKKEVNVAGCSMLGRSLANNRAAFVAEWKQFEKIVFEQLLELDEFSASDIFGVPSLKALESRLNA